MWQTGAWSLASPQDDSHIHSYLTPVRNTSHYITSLSNLLLQCELKFKYNILLYSIRRKSLVPHMNNKKIDQIYMYNIFQSKRAQ